MSFQFKFSGGAKLAANARTFQANLSKKSKKLVRESGERVLEKAQELVPYEDGDLHDSGRVVVSPKGLSVSVEFGGPGIPQAIPTHEHPSQYSPPSWQAAEASGKGVTFHTPGTGPGYLRKPWLEESDILAKELHQGLNVEDLL